MLTFQYDVIELDMTENGSSVAIPLNEFVAKAGQEYGFDCGQIEYELTMLEIEPSS